MRQVRLRDSSSGFGFRWFNPLIPVLGSRLWLARGQAPAGIRYRAAERSEEPTRQAKSWVPAFVGTNGDAERVKSARWRAVLLGTVAAGALYVAGAHNVEARPQPCVVGPANVVTCSGDHSGGIASGIDFNAPPVDQLVVNNLSGNIAPAAGISGIVFILIGLPGEINILSDTGDFDIVVTGNANGISTDKSDDGQTTIQHIGNIHTQNGTGISALNATNDSDTGAITIGMIGNIVSGSDGIFAGSNVLEGNGNSGAVTVTFTGNLQASGDAIVARSNVGMANGDSGAVTVESNGNLQSAGGIAAESTVAVNGNSGTVSVDHQGLINGGGVFARSTVGGNGDSGAVSVSTTGAIFGRINALSVVGGVGDAGGVSVTSSGNIASQSSSTTAISAISRAETDGDSGSVTVTSTGNLIAATRGIEAIAQSGGAGNTGGVVVSSTGNIVVGNGAGIFADSFAAGPNGNASVVNVTSAGNINAVGDGIEARSRSTGGNAGEVSVNATGTIISTGSDGVLAESQAGGLGNAGNVDVEVAGNVTGAQHGIQAISLAAGGAAGDIVVDLSSGNVIGGAGAGVRIVGGSTNQLTIGASASLSSLSDFAIVSDNANETVTNFGTVTGSVDLAGGNNAFRNEAGGLFNSGASVFLGTGNLLQNAGTLAPGGNGTTLTTHLTGNLILDTGGTFVVDVSAGDADRIHASGSAMLGGRVLPIVQGLLSGTQQFIILSAADGITDTGITVQDTAVFDFELIVGANDLLLQVTADFTAGNADLTPDQRAVAVHLDNVLNAGGGALGNLFAYLGSLLDPASYAAALDRLHPEPYLAQLKSLLFGSLGFTDSILSCPVVAGPNVAATLAEGQCAWARIGGRALEVDRTRENIGFTDRSWGGSAGVQFNLAPNWLGSIALGYDRSDIRVDDRAVASGDVFQIGAGAKYTMGDWQFSGTVTSGLASYDTTRFNVMPGVNATGDASHTFLAGRLRAVHVFGTEAGYVKPLVDLDVIVVRRDGVTEAGAGGAGLNVKGQTDAFFSIAPAVEIGGQFAYASGTLLRPFLRAGIRLFSDDDLSASATFIGTPAGVPAFTATTPLGQWMGEVSAGLDFLNSDRFDARISYEGRFAERTTQHGGNIKFRAKF